MAVEYNTNTYTTGKQILVFPDHYVAVAHTFLQNDAAATTVGGKKIVKAGTVYPTNDGDAIGIVFYDCDVTNGDATGALLRHGWLKKSKLPANPSAAARAALPMIDILPV